MKIKKIIGISIVLLSALIAACGSSDTETPIFDDETNTFTGRFVDSPVAGLEFTTSSGLSGITNVDGEFDYLDGDTITFSLGPILLGEVRALPIITPFDLMGFVLPSGDLSLSDLLVEILRIDRGSVTSFGDAVNMLIFLQTLDNNDDPDDGIEIASTIASFFLEIGAALEFDQSTEDFVAAFLILFVQLVENGILDRDADAEPVDRDSAIQHFISSSAF